MAGRIDLAAKGIRLFAGRLYNHDYLWFSSTEISKVSTTLPIIHNYALSYALASFSYGIYRGSMPKYFEDLNKMPLYALPARNDTAQKTVITFNALDDKTLRTDAGGKINTPNLGKRVCINPEFELPEEKAELGYHFYLFTFNLFTPPAVCRLGKKGCPVRVYWQEFKNPAAFFYEAIQRPTHVVNPLDISGEVKAYDPVIIPPHLLFRMVEVAGDWLVMQEGHRVLVPKRVLERAS